MKKAIIGVIILYASNVVAADSNLFTCSSVLPQNALTKTVKGKKTVEADGIITQESYTRLTDTKNKCFKITASELIYLIDRDQAVYEIYTDDYVNPWVMIDFHKAPAPHDRFKGIVKGVGKYTYKDGKGIPRKIPYMIVIK